MGFEWSKDRRKKSRCQTFFDRTWNFLKDSSVCFVMLSKFNVNICEITVADARLACEIVKSI